MLAGYRASVTLIHCWYYHFRKLFSHFFIKLNTHLSLDPVIPLPEVHTTEMKRSLYNNVYKNVYSNFIHNSTKLETTKMSLDKRRDKKL